MKMLIGLCGLILALLSSITAQPPIQYDMFLQAKGSDCTEIKRLQPHSTSGVYVIHNAASRATFKVYCEMRPDGGWTVIQKRTGPSLSFNQNWRAYESGFGELISDHWLGLKKIYWLTQTPSKKMTLRVDLWGHERETAYAEYKDFKLGRPEEGYKLNVGTYSGTAGDAIRGGQYDESQNGFGFSTFDKDYDGCDPCIFDDIAVTECAQYDDGWWFSRCGAAALNGQYHESGDHIGFHSGLHWRTWMYPVSYSAKATRMMIKSE